jgi:hypothetical protein
VNTRVLLHTEQTVSPLESSFCLGEGGGKSVYSGNDMKQIRERRICGESAAILNIKAGGI